MGIYQNSAKEIEINKNISQLKKLLCERYNDTTELEKELEILRSIFFDAQTYKKEEKIEALKLSKNVSIRIFTKRYLDFQENISQLIKENDRLAEIEKKYNTIIENIS